MNQETDQRLLALSQTLSLHTVEIEDINHEEILVIDQVLEGLHHTHEVDQATAEVTETSQKDNLAVTKLEAEAHMEIEDLHQLDHHTEIVGVLHHTDEELLVHHMHHLIEEAQVLVTNHEQEVHITIEGLHQLEAHTVTEEVLQLDHHTHHLHEEDTAVVVDNDHSQTDEATVEAPHDDHLSKVDEQALIQCNSSTLTLLKQKWRYTHRHTSLVHLV